MCRRFPLVLALTLVLALPALAQTAAPEKSDKDTPRVTPAGTTFTLPAGWTMTAQGAVTLLGLPETDSHVAIVDVKAKDADAAVAAGWAGYQPGFKRPLKIALPQAALNGW